MSTIASESRPNPLLACLWKENPNRLVSLWEIVQPFKAGECCTLFALMAQYEQVAAANPPRDLVPLETMGSIDSIIHGTIFIATETGLGESLDFARRLDKDLKDSGRYGELQHGLKQLRDLIESEIRKKHMMVIPDDLAKYYKAKRPLGKAVYDSFPSARFDLTEAGNCLACGNNMAATMHLMRASEVGLWELGRDRQIPLAKSGKIEFAEWGSIIKELEDAVKLVQQWPNSQLKEKAHKLYNHALVEIRAFNDGWRRHAAHVRPEPKMEDDEVLALWGHVTRFFGALTPKIGEGKYMPLVW